jgi:hypothetical protein
VGKPGICLCRCLEGVIGDDKFQTLHGLQSALESFARFDEMAEGLVVVGLDGEGGIVGGRVKERGFGKVEEN